MSGIHHYHHTIQESYSMLVIGNASGKSPLRKAATGLALAAFALLLGSYIQTSRADPPSQKTFRSGEEASYALYLAVQKHDEQALTQILGGKELISSDDDVQDTLDRERFAKKYQEMHRLARQPDGVTVLYIGAENWPFPIPLVSRNGVWRFDADAGGKEVQFRRIGENEETAIALCHALVAAEKHPGSAGQTAIPATVLADAKRDHKPILYHGYDFRVLSSSGNHFAAIAYPASYRASGVMTFIVDQHDVVYQKDLGLNTAGAAQAMVEYHRDSTWQPADLDSDH